MWFKLDNNCAISQVSPEKKVRAGLAVLLSRHKGGAAFLQRWRLKQMFAAIGCERFSFQQEYMYMDYNCIATALSEMF
jgi:hypothetical protein